MQEVTITQASPAPVVSIEAGPGNLAQTIALPAPRTAGEIASLRLRRSELVSQLDRTRSRRGSVLAELEASTGRERVGLEQRLAGLDQRIVQIEGDIGATERALTSAPVAVVGAAEQAEVAARRAREAAEGPIDEDVVAVMAFMGFFLLIPMAVAYARRLWKRPPAASRALSVVTESRLERIEQAVEAIAVEVERVSEGQRFVTRLMSDSRSLPGLERDPSPGHALRGY